MKEERQRNQVSAFQSQHKTCIDGAKSRLPPNEEGEKAWQDERLITVAMRIVVRRAMVMFVFRFR